MKRAHVIKKMWWKMQWKMRFALLPIWGTEAPMNADITTVQLRGFRIPFGSKRWRIAYWSGLVK